VIDMKKGLVFLLLAALGLGMLLKWLRRESM
jgi:hypothetical protein